MKNKFRFLLCFILILSIVVCSSCGQEQKGKKLIKSFVSDAETCGGIDFYKTDGNIVCFVSVERVSEDVSTMMVYKTTVGEDNTVEASDVYLVAVASTGAAAIYKIPATTDENSDNRISDSWTVINYLTLDSLNTFARVAAKKNVSYLPSKISLDYDEIQNGYSIKSDDTYIGSVAEDEDYNFKMLSFTVGGSMNAYRSITIRSGAIYSIEYMEDINDTDGYNRHIGETIPSDIISIIEDCMVEVQY